MTTPAKLRFHDFVSKPKRRTKKTRHLFHVFEYKTIDSNERCRTMWERWYHTFTLKNRGRNNNNNTKNKKQNFGTFFCFFAASFLVSLLLFILVVVFVQFSCRRYICITIFYWIFFILLYAGYQVPIPYQQTNPCLQMHTSVRLKTTPCRTTLRSYPEVLRHYHVRRYHCLGSTTSRDLYQGRAHKHAIQEHITHRRLTGHSPLREGIITAQRRQKWRHN